MATNNTLAVPLPPQVPEAVEEEAVVVAVVPAEAAVRPPLVLPAVVLLQMLMN